MTTSKTSLADIIKIEGIKVIEAPDGQRWTKYPSGKPIAFGVKAKFIITVGNRFFAGTTLAALIFRAHKAGKIDLHTYGYDTCHRCSGTGTLTHYSHINYGICLKCDGAGVI